jgi:hypothetical protein
MDIFFWFFFGPFLGLLFFAAGGAALVYFALGVQNLYIGEQEKNPVKRNSGWGAILMSLAIMFGLYLIWYAWA